MSGWEAFGHLTATEKRIAAWSLRVDPATVKGPITGLLVGEMPGANTSEDMPLFPHPANSAGGRLFKMSRLTMGEFLGRIRRVNLLTKYDEVFDVVQARKNAILITQNLLPGTRVVLCGQRVAAAFDLSQYFVKYAHGGSECCAIPHPSGRNRLYNDPQIRGAAGLAIRWAADTRNVK